MASLIAPRTLRISASAFSAGVRRLGESVLCLIAESILRHQRQIPLLFVYSDGSPLDGRRLDSFVFRLQQRAERTLAPV